MQPQKKVIFHLITFGIISMVISWILIAIQTLFSTEFLSNVGPRNAVGLLIAGLITYYKILRRTRFLKGAFLEHGITHQNLIFLYFLMYIVAAVLNLTTGAFAMGAFPVLVAPLIGIIAGVFYYTQKLASESESATFKEKPNTYTEQKPAKDLSIITTGDYIEKPLYVSHGSAHWISDAEKNELTDSKDGIPTFAGLWIGGGFFHHKEGNLVSVAPPGTGKGAALIIPNLLWHREYRHSFVVFDPKGTNACITARFQKESGKKVIIIDPMHLQRANKATHGIPTASFNPLDHLEDDIFNGTSQIANLLIPDDPNGEKFWNQDARNLVQAILMHIMTDKSYIGRRNLVTFYKTMLTADFEDLLDSMIENTALDDTIAEFATGFKTMQTKSEKTFESIKSVANGSIKWLSNPALQACMKVSDFKPEELEEGGIALYICQPIQNKEGFATFSRLIIGFCLRANSKPAAKPKAWVYYLLDEFPTMGIFPEVVECLAYSREYRMRLWLFAQSLSQLDQIYKIEGRHQILGNAKILQAFGVTDHVTQEYISKRIGNKTVKVQTYSTSEGTSRSSSYGQVSGSSSGSSRTTSSSEAFHGKPLIEPADVQYDPSIITISEWGPMRLSRWQYWQKTPNAGFYADRFNDGRADRNPNIENDEFI